MSDHSTAARVLVNSDPRQTAERALSYLVRKHGAHGGAVLSAHPELVPVVNHDTPLSQLAPLLELTTRQSTALRIGKPVILGAHILFPIRDCAVLPPEGPSLVGVLFLFEAKEPPDEGLGAFEPWLAEALYAIQRPDMSLNDYFTSARPIDVERHHLLTVLAKHGWNITAAARDLNVARKTIYNRLERHGIPREHIEKRARG